MTVVSFVVSSYAASMKIARKPNVTGPAIQRVDINDVPPEVEYWYIMGIHGGFFTYTSVGSNNDVYEYWWDVGRNDIHVINHIREAFKKGTRRFMVVRTVWACEKEDFGRYVWEHVDTYRNQNKDVFLKYWIENYYLNQRPKKPDNYFFDM